MNAIKNDIKSINDRLTRISGRGDYSVKSLKAWSNRNKLASRFGSQLGGYATSALGVGPVPGNIVGRALGIKFSNATGWGDYQINSNSLMQTTRSELEPITSFGPDSIRVTHKEYLGNILGSTDFKSNVYRLNPGLSDSFPWLAGIARNYQQYRFNGVIFQFNSTSATALANTSNSSLGKVIIATNYNAEDNLFDSTISMLSTTFSNYAKPAESFVHAIECAPDQTVDTLYYIRTDVDQSNRDLRFTDLGFTQVSTEGMQSNSEVGGLWVTYDITFLKPIINPGNSVDNGVDQFVMQTNNDTIYSLTKATVRNNMLGGSISFTDTAAIYTFNRTVSSGYYLLLQEYTQSTQGDNKMSSSSNSPVLTNCELVVDDDNNGFTNGGYYLGNPTICDTLLGISSTSAAFAVRYNVVKITGPRPIFQFSGVNLAGPGIYWRFHVIPIGYSETPLNSGPVQESFPQTTMKKKFGRDFIETKVR